MREISLISKLEYKWEYLEYADKKGNIFVDGYPTSWTTDLNKNVYTAEDLVENYNNEMVEDIVKGYIDLFIQRGMTATEQQIDFSRKTAKILLGQLKDTNNIPTISAPCGFGKSTITQVFLEVVCLAYKQGIYTEGLIIVTDKIEQLYELYNNLIDSMGYYKTNSLKNNNKNIPFAYILEGWKEDSYERKVCLNKDVKVYEYGMCSNKCTYFGQCKICNQKYEQFNSPILLMTNARLETCAEGINFYAVYKDKDGNNINRTLRIIDEKPTIRNNFRVNIDVLTDIRKSIDKIDKSIERRILINKWNKITLTIEDKFADFEGNERILVSNINNSPVLLNDIEFTSLWDNFMGKNKYKRELEHIHTVLTKGGLFVNAGARGLFIETIGMKNILNENFKTVIFDATSLIDQDYSNEDIIKFVDIENIRTFNNVTFNFHMQHKLTKTNFNNSNYLMKACVKFLETIKHENTYVVTHSGLAISMLTEIRKNKNLLVNLVDNEFTSLFGKPNIITFNENKLPYYGNTKGNNGAKDCTQMVSFGWNIMPDYEYLIRYLCTQYSEEELKKVFESCSDLENSKKLIDDIMTDKSEITLYKNYCMLVDFIQEVFRTSLRKYDCTEDITINCFKCDYILISMIRQMFPQCNVNINKNELECFTESKILGRETKDGNMTAPQKFIEWNENWNGDKISVTELKKQCNITDSQWKDLKRKKDIKNMIDKLHNTKEGRTYYYSK